VREVSGFGFRVPGFEFRAWNFGYMVSCIGEVLVHDRGQLLRHPVVTFLLVARFRFPALDFGHKVCGVFFRVYGARIVWNEG